MKDENRQPEYDVLDKIHEGMIALSKKHKIDLWFSMSTPFPMMRFMFDNGEKDITIELNVREQLDTDIKKYIEEDVEEYIVDFFGLKNEVKAE